MTGLTDLLAETSLTEVAVREVHWLFRIEATDLWRAVVGGIATIGQTYQAQQPVVQNRMRDAYCQLTSERYPSGELRLPSSALLASATSKAA